jgi:Na+/H+ antiporter NhaD/arsenite permease-like protein
MMETLGHLLPLWSVAPFALLLLAIAVLPLASGPWWEKNRNKALTAAILSLPVLFLFWSLGDFRPLVHEIGEYASFITLLGSLFVISGGIYVHGDIQATPQNNTLFLALGGVIANLFGTTGAAMLLIRPLLRTNSERTRVAHIPVFFIFVVANVGGCLLPIGDPPLFMGYLRGVPFFWTLKLLPEWLFMMALLLTTFYFVDSHFWRKEPTHVLAWDKTHVRPLGVFGRINVLLIMGVLASVIFLKAPVREAVMAALAVLSLRFTHPRVRQRNEFHFAPIVEVAVLFAGIFITMVPALLILEARGAELGVQKPWHFFWAAGGLSSFLDNAPTYLTFLSLAQGLTAAGDLAKEVAGIPVELLKAISLGAVFMGANTYIGNGPNFMVKVICEHQKVKMPSFFGYMAWSGAVLIPLFVLVTFVFFV